MAILARHDVAALHVDAHLRGCGRIRRVVHTDNMIPYVMSCHVMSCHVRSGQVRSGYVVLCCVVGCHDMLWYAMLCYALLRLGCLLAGGHLGRLAPGAEDLRLRARLRVAGPVLREPLGRRAGPPAALGRVEHAPLPGLHAAAAEEAAGT